jgi:hypothetical protein
LIDCSDGTWQSQSSHHEPGTGIHIFGYGKLTGSFKQHPARNGVDNTRAFALVNSLYVLRASAKPESRRNAFRQDQAPSTHSPPPLQPSCSCLKNRCIVGPLSSLAETTLALEWHPDVWRQIESGEGSAAHTRTHPHNTALRFGWRAGW